MFRIIEIKKIQVFIKFLPFFLILDVRLILAGVFAAANVSVQQEKRENNNDCAGLCVRPLAPILNSIEFRKSG